MIVPAPAPVFTLVPGLPELTAAQDRLLQACLGTLSGRVCGVMVTRAATVGDLDVLELQTSEGAVIAVERRAAA